MIFGKDRPRDCGTVEERDELAPLHVPSARITLYAGLKRYHLSDPQCPLWVKSRHVQRTSQCPLSANSGHWLVRWASPLLSTTQPIERREHRTDLLTNLGTQVDVLKPLH